jgi:hypothetical protein
MQIYRRRRSIAGAIFRRCSEDRLRLPGSRFIASLLAATGGAPTLGIEQESARV